MSAGMKGSNSSETISINPVMDLVNVEAARNGFLAAKRIVEEHGLGDMGENSLRDVCKDGLGLVNYLEVVLLDLPHPWDVVSSAKLAIKPSRGRFCAFSPRIEQVRLTCERLGLEGLADMRTAKLIPRTHKVVGMEKDELSPNPIRARSFRMEWTDEEAFESHSVAFRTTDLTGYLTSATLPPKDCVAFVDVLGV